MVGTDPCILKSGSCHSRSEAEMSIFWVDICCILQCEDSSVQTLTLTRGYNMVAVPFGWRAVSPCIPKPPRPIIKIVIFFTFFHLAYIMLCTCDKFQTKFVQSLKEGYSHRRSTHPSPSRPLCGTARCGAVSRARRTGTTPRFQL